MSVRGAGQGSLLPLVPSPPGAASCFVKKQLFHKMLSSSQSSTQFTDTFIFYIFVMQHRIPGCSLLILLPQLNQAKEVCIEKYENAFSLLWLCE